MKRLLLFIVSVACFGQVNGLGHSTLTCLDKDGDGYGQGTGCTGPDADDNDDAIHSAAQTISAYGSINAFLIHLGYQAGSSPSTVWCLDPAGSDMTGASNANADTACTTPFLTYNHIIGMLSPPYVVLYRTGTFTQSIAVVSGASTPRNSVIMSYPGEKATIDCSALSGNCINAAGAVAYTTVDGLKILGNGSGAGYQGGTYILYMSGSQTILFHDNVIRRCELSGAGLDSNINADNMTNFLVEENIAHDPFPMGGQHNIYLGSSTVASTGVVIRRNIVYNVNTGGYPNIQFNGRCTSGCAIDDNMAYNQDGQGIAILEGFSNGSISRNLVFNTGEVGNPPLSLTIANYDSGQCQMTGLPSICPWDQTGNVIENNTFWAGTNAPDGSGTNNGETVEIANNAITGPCGTGSPPCGNVGGNFYRNNVIVDWAGSMAVPPIYYPSANPVNYLALDLWVNNTIISAVATSTFVASEGGTALTCSTMTSGALSGSTGCSTSDPMFVAASNSYYNTPASFNLRLASGSPAIKAGVATGAPTYDLLGLFYNHTTPSRGAYEFLPFVQGWTDLGSGTQLQQACPANGYNTGTTVGGVTQDNYAWSDNCHGIEDAYSGAAPDTKRNQLMLHGGGHVAYHGNEIYVLDPVAATMTRLTNPSVVNTTSSPPSDCNPANAMLQTSDSLPVSIHTYTMLVYLPTIDAAWRWQGINFCADSAPPRYMWLFNRASSTWTNKGIDGIAGSGGNYFSYSAYSALRNSVISYWSGNAMVTEYDITGGTMAARTTFGSAPTLSDVSGNIDTSRNLMIFAGNDGAGTAQIYTLDVSAGTSWAWSSNLASTATGCSALTGSNYSNPGVEYDATVDRIVIYSGTGNSLLWYNRDTNTCTTKTFSTGPSASVVNGQYGRFRLLPDLNAYVAVPTSSTINAFALGFNSSTGGSFPGAGGSSFGGKMSTGGKFSVGP